MIWAIFSGPPSDRLFFRLDRAGHRDHPLYFRVSGDVFNAVPPSLKEAAVALGSTRWNILEQDDFPYTRSAMIGAIFLGLAERSAKPWPSRSCLEMRMICRPPAMPSDSIAAAIANEFTEADADLDRRR